MSTISKPLNRCPRTNNIIPGHYMSSMANTAIPTTARSVSVLLDKADGNHLTIIDSQNSRARENWFFHNGALLRLNSAVETFAEFDEKIIYARFLGDAVYRVFLCSPYVNILECPDVEAERNIKNNVKPHSFLDNLSHQHLNKSRVKSLEDKTTVISSPQPARQTFLVPKPPRIFAPTGNNTTQPVNRLSKPEWLPANQAITIKGIVIPSGLIYIGQPNADEPDWTMSPAIINLRSHINLSSPDTQAKGVGYWPSYSGTTPEARAAYLQWLSGSRDNSEDPISWVFLFFFGLERRVVLDMKLDPSAKTDLPIIKAEVLRLRNIYGSHLSFNKYSEGLIHLMDLISDPVPEETLVGNTHDKGRYPWWLRIKFGKLARNQLPLPAELALAWARTHPDINLPKPAVRCKDEFDALFNIRYREKYDFGMILPDLKQRLIFRYQPATSGMEIISVDTGLPDVYRSIKIYNIMKQLVEECTEELGKYSRFLARNPEAKGSVKALELLPVVLLSEEEKQLIASQVKPTKKSSKAQAATPIIIPATPVVLDHGLIARKEAETKKVSELLHSILSDDLVFEEKIDMEDKPFTTEMPWIRLGLDEPHWNLLQILGTKLTWARDEFIVECKKLDLMPNGALDMLNEAAIAYANELLTDGEETIIVDQLTFEDLLR